MVKIFYCMYVGWNWIKQRPHFIAEELSKENKVFVINDYCYREKRNKINKNKNSNLLIYNFYKIPMAERNCLFSNINLAYKKIVYWCCYKRIDPDYIYVMAPNTVKCIPKSFAGKVIYDCMDDMLQFTNNSKLKNKIYEAERQLVEKSNYVLVSSEHLKSILVKRHGIKYINKYFVVRNAHIFNDYEKNIPHSKKQGNVFTLCYFGTIAEWFDFEMMKKMLDEFENIRLKLIGPYQAGTSFFKHPRVDNVGSVKHECLKNYLDDVDAFIMPFKLNELILSVDPVKLYEYIYFNKDILCIKYPEVERFDKFVYFYEKYDDIRNNLQTLMLKRNNTPKYSIGDRNDFLKNNTWECRVKIINSLLK